jgi:hypothetical protein
MLRRLLVIASFVVCLVGASLGTAGAATVSPGNWAPKFCKAMQQWQTTIKAESTAATDAFSSASGDLTAIRDQFVTFLGNDVAATQLAIKTIKKAGTPSSANGAKISAKFVAGFQAASTVFSNAQTSATALPTTDPGQFVDQATKIQDDLNNAGDQITSAFSGIDRLDKNGDINKAILGAKACKFLTG